MSNVITAFDSHRRNAAGVPSMIVVDPSKVILDEFEEISCFDPSEYDEETEFTEEEEQQPLVETKRAVPVTPTSFPSYYCSSSAKIHDSEHNHNNKRFLPQTTTQIQPLVKRCRTSTYEPSVISQERQQQQQQHRNSQTSSSSSSTAQLSLLQLQYQQCVQRLERSMQHSDMTRFLIQPQRQELLLTPFQPPKHRPVSVASSAASSSHNFAAADEEQTTSSAMPRPLAYDSSLEEYTLYRRQVYQSIHRHSQAFWMGPTATAS